MATSKASVLYPNSHKRGADVAKESGVPKQGAPSGAWPWGGGAGKRAGEPKPAVGGGVAAKVQPKAPTKQSGRKDPVHIVSAAAAKLYPKHGNGGRS